MPMFNEVHLAGYVAEDARHCKQGAGRIIIEVIPRGQPPRDPRDPPDPAFPVVVMCKPSGAGQFQRTCTRGHYVDLRGTLAWDMITRPPRLEVRVNQTDVQVTKKAPPGPPEPGSSPDNPIVVPPLGKKPPDPE